MSHKQRIMGNAVQGPLMKKMDGLSVLTANRCNSDGKPVKANKTMTDTTVGLSLTSFIMSSVALKEHVLH